jgi:hypothetical protein
MRVLFRPKFGRTLLPLSDRITSKLQRIILSEPVNEFRGVARKVMFGRKGLPFCRKSKQPGLALDHGVVS